MCVRREHGLERKPGTRLGVGSSENTYRNHISPGGPVNPEFLERLESQPSARGAVDDEGLIEGPGEEERCEPDGAGRVDEARRPVAHEVQGLLLGREPGREQGKRHEGADGR